MSFAQSPFPFPSFLSRSPKLTKSLDEIRTIAVSRATDDLRGILSIVEQSGLGSRLNCPTIGSALLDLANKIYERNLAVVSREHLEEEPIPGMGMVYPWDPSTYPAPGTITDDDAHLRHGSIVRMRSSDALHVRPHRFSRPAVSADEPIAAHPSCAVCGRGEKDLAHHPDLLEPDEPDGAGSS
jgi:hypothetical protein